MTEISVDLETVEKNFNLEIREVKSFQELREIKARYLGKKGELSTLLHTLGHLPAEERPALGERANRLKERIEGECRVRLNLLEKEKTETRIREAGIDVTLPGRALPRGGRHPVTQTLEEVERIFLSLGFEAIEGPEVESDYYNFEALNIPANHPARDMQDTFYLMNCSPSSRPPPQWGGGSVEGEDSFDKPPVTSHQPLLLRTHTSPVQIHVMKGRKPPIRMIAPGVVYRRDSDMTHSPMFHQVEGLAVGDGIRFSDLKGTLIHFLKIFFQKEMKVRFRPSYFPFTEPSAEVDVEWKKGEWLEVAGCGLVHPNVFRAVHYSPKTSGFAFGMGIERLAMLKFGIPDIRLFFENDLRFLEQFS